ncbi:MULTISPECIES: hypothetical protein [Streptomyces]|uniref:Uncharacterized protein n=1 Tax=Streptomyces virginiae TaxID=1961 RepID=A0ABZ1T9Z7_STRVG|nr:hypothetical protein [Streptomyces virginiae]WTB21804.1 hypothetical protein OG253_10040 [Streptomyces virginiae]
MMTPQITRGRRMTAALFVSAVVMTAAAAVAALVRYIPQWTGS